MPQVSQASPRQRLEENEQRLSLLRQTDSEAGLKIGRLMRCSLLCCAWIVLRVHAAFAAFARTHGQ